MATLFPADPAIAFRPEVEDVDLSTWVAGNRPLVLEQLSKAGALLFRGFKIGSLAQFQAFTRSVCPELIEYGERSSPRTKLDDGVYTSTDHPQDQPILLHNEQSYTLHWPMKIWFFCQQPLLLVMHADCRQPENFAAPQPANCRELLPQAGHVCPKLW